MKRMISGAAVIAVLALALPLTAVQADDGHHRRHGKGGHMMHGPGHAGSHGDHGIRRHHRRSGRGKIRLQRALDRFDLDKDGSITQAEVDQFRTDRLNAFDKDGDGTLSLDEYEALWLDAMKKRMVRTFQRHDTDGDGKVTAEEFAERTRHMVLRRDRNDDGVLNKDDLKHMRRAPGKGRRPHRMRKEQTSE